MAESVRRLVYFKRWMAPVAGEILAKRPDIQVTRLDFPGQDEKCWRVLEQANGYQCLPRTESSGQWLASADLIARCPNLLAVCSMGAGYDVIDVEACTAAGIIVCNQSGTNKEAVAEHALGFMLSLTKKIAYWDHVMRRVPDVDRFTVEGNDLRGKILGIVGIGQIGGRLAELCRGIFAMKILAYDPYLTAEQIAERGAIKVDLDALLRESDFVSLNCPLTSETEGMIGADQYRLMKPSAYFVTTARGRVHDEDALVDALKQNRIAGAGVDVFNVEPPPLDHPLLGFDNVVVSPHMGGITVEATNETAAHAARQWIKIFDGDVPPRLVNAEVWPLYSERFQRIFGRRPSALT